MEQNLICFFSISNFSHCFLCFLWCVIVNGHLYVNMKKNQDQVLIDGLLETHVGLAFFGERRTREILPRLSFNLLISRLSTSLCMVFGSCCISLKMKSWREDSYCVEKKIFIGRFFFFTNGYFSGGNSNSIHLPRLWVSRTRDDKNLDHPSAVQSVQRRHDVQRVRAPFGFSGWIDLRLPGRKKQV